MAVRKGLGRGLDLLIPKDEGMPKKSIEKNKENKEPKENQVLTLSIHDVEPNRNQPRKQFDEDAIEELADSIKQYGVIQPLIVQKKDKYYEIIAGERRWRASKLVGLKEIPAVIKDYSDKEALEIALIENIQRRDLHYLEEATAIAAYLRQSGSTQEEAAALLGRSPSALANKLRLLRLSPDCCRLLTEHDLTERHARALLRLEDEEERLNALHHIIRQHLNVAQTEQYIDKRLAQLQATPPSGRRVFLLKDVRLFLNSRARGLRLVREAGIGAESRREDTEDAILLTIRIPKNRRVG